MEVEKTEQFLYFERPASLLEHPPL